MKSFHLIFLGLFVLAQFTATALLADEKLPGGTGSTSDFSVNAFGHPLSGTRGQDRRDFVVGNSFFKSAWVAAPASTLIRDGLGPVYNAVSCSSCHLLDGRGRGLPDEAGPVDISLLFRLRVKKDYLEVAPHPLYGEQFQPQGIEGVAGEGKVSVTYRPLRGYFSDGSSYELLRPSYHFSQLAYGPLGDDLIASPRVAPQMIGLGLIEAIKAQDILDFADPMDLDGDGISGRANLVSSQVLGPNTLGRFGWKAGKATLKEQNAAAFNGDIGITTSLFPREECTYVQLDCADRRSGLDMEDDVLSKVTIYTQLLAVPVRRASDRPEIKRGKDLFHAINCQSCHRASYVTGNDSEFSTLRNQTIYPYSDFLLHDMGDELADDSQDYLNEELASAREWRTPPLWGIGLIKTVNGHTRLLHDGRARNVEEAILWHGGEAQASRDLYLTLNQQERQELIQFIESL